MPQGTYRHFLKIFLRGEAEPLIVEVRKQEVDRLQRTLEAASGAPNQIDFFWFDAVDGKTFVVNLRLAQAFHFLWEPSLPSDQTRYEGPIVIALRGREERLEAGTDSPEQLYVFFTELQHGSDVIPFSGFEDEDGESLIVRASEVAYIMAPLHLVEEGRKIVDRELRGQRPDGEDR